MDINTVWWVWIIVGAIFLLIELFTATFFGLWMAIAALIPAIITLIKPDISLEIQIIAWIIAMIICSWLWVRFSKRDIPLADMDSQLIGQIGILAKGCDTTTEGILLLQKPVDGSSQWKCIADQSIATETRVIVTERINKTLLRVTLEPKHTSNN